MFMCSMQHGRETSVEVRGVAILSGMMKPCVVPCASMSPGFCIFHSSGDGVH
jgi:hypothetical protein